jgi:hypothetical protein
MTSATVSFIEVKKNKQLVQLTIKYISADALPLKDDKVNLIAGYQHQVIERHFTYGDSLQVEIFVQETPMGVA